MEHVDKITKGGSEFTSEELSPRQKVAVLMVSLGRDNAAEIMKYLTDFERGYHSHFSRKPLEHNVNWLWVTPYTPKIPLASPVPPTAITAQRPLWAYPYASERRLLSAALSVRQRAIPLHLPDAGVPLL